MRFVGIDIASETHVVAAVAEDGTALLKPVSFKEDAAGYALREAGVSRDEVQALAPASQPAHHVYDLGDDQRRKRALATLEDLERRGRQTGVNARVHYPGALRASLAFDDERDFAEAKKGFIAAPKERQIERVRA